MKSALIVAGRPQLHTPMESSLIFADLLREEGFQVEIAETLEVFGDEEKLNSLSLVVPNWTMGALTRPQEKTLLQAVRSGVGIGGWHGGMGDAFRDSPTYQFMVGGQFVQHPFKDSWQVNVVNRDDPITEGIQDFWMKTEQYYMHVDPSNDVLATTTFSVEKLPWIDGCVMPVVWKRVWGEGRVFYASYGHTYEDFDVPEAREIVRRGLLWASR